MTAKQYNFNVNNGCIEKNGKFLAYLSIIDESRIVDELNKIAEENEQLKSEYKVLHTQYQDLRRFVENNFDEYMTQEKLTREIEQLKKDCKYWQKSSSFWKRQESKNDIENDKLREEIEHIKELLKEVEHELTSLTGLTAFDKCETQLGYVEVFDEDRIELDYSNLLRKIDKI